MDGSRDPRVPLFFLLIYVIYTSGDMTVNTDRYYVHVLTDRRNVPFVKKIY